MIKKRKKEMIDGERKILDKLKRFMDRKKKRNTEIR